MIGASGNTPLRSYAMVILDQDHFNQGDLTVDALADYNDDCVAVDAWIAGVAGAPFWEGE